MTQDDGSRKILGDVTADATPPENEGSNESGKVPVKCPHCSGLISYRYVSRLAAESKMQFKLVPAPGEFMSAKNIGKGIEAMGALLISCGKDMGVKTNVLVEDITSDNGAVTVSLLITRHEPGIKRKPDKGLTGV